MIKFFRNIRQKLLNEGKTTNYLKYAIGEIVLVVIGILIALQINNWNENQKNKIIGKQYLRGIKEDLKEDLIHADSILILQSYNISVISSIDSVLYRKYGHQNNKIKNLFIKPDSLTIDFLFNRNTSFRPTNGTYKSLIADGKSGLISNKQLFQKIQQIYDGDHARLTSTYEAIKMIEQKINWAYPFEAQNWTYNDLKKAKNEKIFYNLVDFTEEKYWYASNIISIIESSQKVISLIEKELSND